MTVHRNRFLVNKSNRCTEFQFYWYNYSTCFGQPLFHPTPDSKPSQLHKVYQSRCTAKNSWWWAERLSESCRVAIPIKFGFCASVGFIHKEHYSCHKLFSQTFSSVLFATVLSVCSSFRGKNQVLLA
jgi:hypothetical protein